MRIKKAGILIIAAAITCTTPAVPAMAADTSESVQEIISDNEIDSLVSDPDKVVDIIMYVKNEAAKQDISDDQIRSLIQTAESTAGVSLSEEEENRIIKIVKQIKDSDIDEEQLRSAVTKAYDKLEEMGIMNRKGFPESYDAKKLMNFLSSVKSGQPLLEVPVYSHLYYDIVPNQTLTIELPDILIVEGINVLQVSNNHSNKKRHVFVSDFFDFSIYVDASEKDLRKWYLDRFVILQKTAFADPESFFHQYSTWSKSKLLKYANEVWEEINLPNLNENILPTRFRADLIIEKGPEHYTRGIRIRKI